MLLSRHTVSVWEDEKVLEMDGCGGGTTLHGLMPLNSTLVVNVTRGLTHYSTSGRAVPCLFQKGDSLAPHAEDKEEALGTGTHSVNGGYCYPSKEECEVCSKHPHVRGTATGPRERPRRLTQLLGPTLPLNPELPGSQSKDETSPVRKDEAFRFPKRDHLVLATEAERF